MDRDTFGNLWTDAANHMAGQGVFPEKHVDGKRIVPTGKWSVWLGQRLGFLASRNGNRQMFDSEEALTALTRRQ